MKWAYIGIFTSDKTSENKVGIEMEIEIFAYFSFDFLSEIREMTFGSFYSNFRKRKAKKGVLLREQYCICFLWIYKHTYRHLSIQLNSTFAMNVVLSNIVFKMEHLKNYLWISMIGFIFCHNFTQTYPGIHTYYTRSVIFERT